MDTQNSNIARIIVIVAIILIGGGALTHSLLGKKMTPAVTMAATTTSDTTAQPAAVASTTTVTTSTTSVYKDGTYTVTGSYLSPGGNEKLGVTITLKDDIITAATVTPEPVSSEGQHFQGLFVANFKPLVIGKDIADVHLTQVSGSSLTPGGFDSALAQIEAQAKA